MSALVGFCNGLRGSDAMVSCLRIASYLFVEQNVRRSLQEADRAYILEARRVALCRTYAALREEEVKKAYFGV